MILRIKYAEVKKKKERIFALKDLPVERGRRVHKHLQRRVAGSRFVEDVHPVPTNGTGRGGEAPLLVTATPRLIINQMRPGKNAEEHANQLCSGMFPKKPSPAGSEDHWALGGPLGPERSCPGGDLGFLHLLLSFSLVPSPPALPCPWESRIEVWTRFKSLKTEILAKQVRIQIFLTYTKTGGFSSMFSLCFGWFTVWLSSSVGGWGWGQGDEGLQRAGAGGGMGAASWESKWRNVLTSGTQKHLQCVKYIHILKYNPSSFLT